MSDNPTFPCGHPRTPENTSTPPSANPGGRCRQCQRDRGKKLKKRTHCHRGHKLTPENAYVDSRGYRLCRECRALAQARYYADPGARVDEVSRFVEWLNTWLEVNETTGDQLAKQAGISPRVLYAVRREGRQWLHLDTVDAILIAAGAIDLFGCFHSANGEPLMPLPRQYRPRKVTDKSTRCRSGDDCARRWGHGPNGRFCVHHGAELERIFAELRPNSAKQSEIRRRLFAKGRAGEVPA